MADFSDFLKSGTFAFEFPSENVTLNVHRDIFKDHSDPLHRMMNHDMKEGKEGKATLEETDSETFIRVVQWAYTGNYIVKPCAVPLPPKGEHDSSAAANTQEDDTSIHDLARQTANQHISSIRTQLTSRSYHNRNNTTPKKAKENTEQNSSQLPSQLNRFAAKRFSSGHVPHLSLSNFLLASDDVLRRSNPLDFPNYSDNRTIPDLTAHAKLYTFADTYLIDSLKGLTLHKLHATLLCFPLLTHPHGIQTFTSLLTYVFTHPTMESLRDAPSPPPPPPPPPPTSLYVSRAHTESQLLQLFPPAHLMNIFALRSVTSYSGHWQLAFTSAQTCKAAMDAQPEERKHPRKGYHGPLVKYWEDKPPKVHALTRGGGGPPDPTELLHRYHAGDNTTLLYPFRRTSTQHGATLPPEISSWEPDVLPAPPYHRLPFYRRRYLTSATSPSSGSSTSHRDQNQDQDPHAPRPYAANPESMRTLVVDYAVAWKAELVLRKEFMDLFEELSGAMKAIFEAAVNIGGEEEGRGKGKGKGKGKE